LPPSPVTDPPEAGGDSLAAPPPRPPRNIGASLLAERMAAVPFADGVRACVGLRDGAMACGLRFFVRCAAKGDVPTACADGTLAGERWGAGTAMSGAKARDAHADLPHLDMRKGSMLCAGQRAIGP